MVHQSAKFIFKHLLENNQMLGFLSYASFHFSYSTGFFSKFLEVYWHNKLLHRPNKRVCWIFFW